MVLWEQKICRALQEMNEPFEERVLCSMTAAVVLRGSAIALHPEGPLQFSSSWPRRPLGETLAVRRMLASHGWTVVPVAKHEYGALRPEKRLPYLVRLIADARAAVGAAPLAAGGAG